jgi:putative FmdB family regulatory protein
MPIYEYRCEDCGHQQEFMQKVSEPPLAACPQCGRTNFRKLLSAAGFQLKGTGWYATDFRGGGKAPQKKAQPGGEATGESKSDAQPEAKPGAKPSTAAAN